MKTHDWIFFVSEAFNGMRRSSLMSVICVVTVAVSLVVFGLFLILTLNLNNLATLLTSKLEIRLFLKDNLKTEEVMTFRSKIEKIAGIKSIIVIDRDKAWEDFKENFQNLNLDETVKRNPLPYTISIQLNKEQSIVPVAKYLQGFDYYVDDVAYGGEIAERMEKFSHFANVGGLILVSLLGFSTLLIIVNTIRLTVIARQDEITIMRLVGATDTFIRWPFLIEGFMIGLVSACFAVLFLWIGYAVGGATIQESVPFFPLVFQERQLMSIYIVVGVVGALIGIVGAYISVSKTLKTQV